MDNSYWFDKCILLVFLVATLFSMVSCQKSDREITSNATTKTPNNISQEKTGKEFDWKQGVKVNDVLDYLNISNEERLKSESEAINAVFDKGDTIWFQTEKSCYKSSMGTKQLEVYDVSPRYVFDRQFSMIHSFKFIDTSVNKEILVTEKVNLKEYNTQNIDVPMVDFCKNKVLIYLYAGSNEKTKWGSYLENSFPTYLVFDLQSYSYELIKLSELVYDESNVDSSASAVLIDVDKILIAYRYKTDKCKAMVYNFNTKEFISEYEIDPNSSLARGSHANSIVSPNGKYILYNGGGQTPTELYLYNLDNNNEYAIVKDTETNSQLYTFYNWDDEDEFFYGVMGTDIKENTFYSKKASEIVSK